MAKLTLTTVGSLGNPISAQATLNANNAAIVGAFENTLSRDGTAPNNMVADLDMDGNRILNLAQPVSPQDAANREYVDAAIALYNGDVANSPQTILGNKTFILDVSVPGERIEIQKDASPVDYTGTRAAFVFQRRDEGSGASNEGIPSAVFLSTWDGDGVVSALPNLSSTVGQGVLFAAEKYGDGSMHAASFKGQLWGGGAVGYNELALNSGDVTNRGSLNGYIAGTEWLLKDGTGAGVSGVDNFPTALQGFVSRIAKWNAAAAPNYPSINFLASSEGTVAPDSILGINNGGLKQWKVGIDLRNGTYTTTAAIALPNASYIFTNDTGGTSRLFLGTNGANSNIIFANSNSGYFQLIAGDAATTLLEANLALDASNPMLLFVNGALKRVTAGAADSAGAGFRALRVPN